MVVILVLLTFALIIVINLLVTSRQKTIAKSKTMGVPTISAAIEDSERLFHPGHSWALVQHPQLVTVGIDNFPQHFIGHLEHIDLPLKDSFIHQGDPLITLHRGRKSLTLVAPLSGTLSNLNQSLASHPELLNRSPYKEGWIANIIPSNLPIELRNLMKGVTASLWRETLRIQLVQWFTPRFGPILQDGGQLVENLSDLLPDDEWEKLVKEFFPTDIPREQMNLRPLK